MKGKNQAKLSGAAGNITAVFMEAYMKISKVNHKRTGVAVSEGVVSGILYDSPSSGPREKTLEHSGQRIETYIKEELNKKIQRFYTILIIPKNSSKSQSSKLEKTIVIYFNRLFSDFLQGYDEKKDSQEQIEEQISFLKHLEGKKIFRVYPSKGGKSNRKKPQFKSVSEITLSFGRREKAEVIEELAETCLRESLKKTVKIKCEGEEAVHSLRLSEVVKKLLSAMCAGRDYAEEFGKISNEDLHLFLTAVVNDYTKQRQIKYIAKSISNQNVKVQPVCRHDMYLLELSSASNRKKAYIFEFLKEYTNADRAGRDVLLSGFRQLMVLYYCGPEKYQEIKQRPMPVWSFETGFIDEEMLFSSQAHELVLLIKRTKNRTQRGKLTEQLNETLKIEIMQRYRNSVSTLKEDNDSKNARWLQFIERNAEKSLIGKEELNPDKLTVRWLCSNTWKTFVSFISMKYVDLGKAVYHFAVPELTPENLRSPLIIGEVLPQYREGISSFDYEKIKADERMERELMVHITFAINNFSRAAIGDRPLKKSREDILQVKEADLKFHWNVKKRLLQYYGGYSKWEDSSIADCDQRELALAIREELIKVRNSSFHYTGILSAETSQPGELIYKMFANEFSKLGAAYRKKYYINHTLMFYSRRQIDVLMDYLYDSPQKRSAQPPSFGKLISRANLPEFVKLYPGKEAVEELEKSEKWDIYCNSLYFILKEAYYNGFLQEPDLLEQFQKAVRQETAAIQAEAVSVKTRKNHTAAMQSFEKRILQLTRDKDMSFGKLCQRLMSDYNLQNRGNQKVQANGAQLQEQSSYEHFRTLLHLCVKRAFLTYLENTAVNGENIFAFLKQPLLNETIYEELSLEEFCRGWQANTFDDLERIKEHGLIFAWYTAAHFLMPRHLQQLAGSIKGYIEFLRDVSCRSLENGHRRERMPDVEYKVKAYEELLRILEFSKLYCGQVSLILEDYFPHPSEYAMHIGNYVDISGEFRKPAALLRAFCRAELEEACGGRINIYYSGKTPIIHKNVIWSMMYGSNRLLRKCLKEYKVSKEEIVEYYQLRAAQLEDSSSRDMHCKVEEQQRRLKALQQAKSRIDLQDVITFSEIINDLLSQLITWNYLRERDLMYFQLGFHYIRLFYRNKEWNEVADDKFHSLKGWIQETEKNESFHLNIEDGALLYQIIAMYTYSLPIYQVNENGEAEKAKKQGSTGAKVTAFYKEYCCSDDSIYNAGLELFEYLKEHDAIVESRNYMTHFKYYANMERSILDMYSEVYDRFFTYDPKLKKSVTYIFSNILMRYFVIPQIQMEKMERICQDSGYVTRTTARLALKEQDGLISDVIHYKLKTENGKEQEHKITIPARSETFLRQLRAILEVSELKEDGQDSRATRNNRSK